MRRLDGFRVSCAVVIAIFLSFNPQGSHCELVVSPVSPTQLSAVAGGTVTLAVSFTGATNPALIWYMGESPVVTGTINSPSVTDIPTHRGNVLKLEQNGSLTFVNVTIDYTNNYTVEMTKAGLGASRTSFTLRVFDIIQSVTLSAHPDLAKEGSDRVTLTYSVFQGAVEQLTWFFGNVRINASSHYSLEERTLVINRPTRSDTGQYAVLLTNPFSSVTTRVNVTVLYGPDEPLLEAHPAQPYYVSGDSLSLSCQAEGFPLPTAKWIFGGQILSNSHRGVLNLTNVQPNQGGVYTCTVVNEETKEERSKSMTLNVYERPPGNPMCSLLAVNDVKMQYHCRWSGGTPEANLTFPVLSNTSSGAGNFSLTLSASDKLNGKTVTCMAAHPLGQNKCNITASSPVAFLPAVRTTVAPDGKIAVTILCVSEASPKAVVSWSKGNETVANGTAYQISSNTTQLEIRYYNVSNFLAQQYSCTCRNPLGSQRREIHLKGPSISDSSLFPNQDGTIITLTWEVPPTSVVTGFDIQMKGPDLQSKNRTGTQTRGGLKGFRTIDRKPGSARSTDIFDLDPNFTYRFRVIPKALMTEGKPSEGHRIGPGEGLSGSAIAGIAAGIPCSLLFLLLLGSFIYFCIYCIKNKERQTRLPQSRAVEKVITTQTKTTPHNLLTGGLKFPPDYNTLHQAPSERSVTLPSFIPPPPIRATIV